MNLSHPSVANANLQHPRCKRGRLTVEKAEAEFGDVLFSLVNYARFIGINPENALERTNKKFIKRFNYLEKRAAESDRELRDMTLAEMDVYWEEAKKL